MPKKVRPIPKGYHSVTASLTQDDSGKTIEFCKNGKMMHAEILIGDSIVMLNDVIQEPARPAGLFLYVPDVDKTLARAVKAGATVVMPVQDMFWGDRFASVTDPSGNRWGIATHREDVPPKEMKKRAAAAFAGGSS